MKKLTKEEFEAVDGLYSYYCSLDIIETDSFGNKDKEAKQSSKEEQATKRGLSKLLDFYKQKEVKKDE